jgi:hypothetical protein
MNWKQFWKDYERIKKSAQRVNKKNKEVMITISTRIIKRK